MIGHPKYNRNDVVLFQIKNNIYSGQICVVDAYGVFEDNTEVHYDIWLYDAEICHDIVLQKHVPEYDIVKKIG